MFSIASRRRETHDKAMKDWKGIAELGILVGRQDTHKQNQRESRNSEAKESKSREKKVTEMPELARGHSRQLLVLERAAGGMNLCKCSLPSMDSCSQKCGEEIEGRFLRTKCEFWHRPLANWTEETTGIPVRNMELPRTFHLTVLVVGRHPNLQGRVPFKI